MKTSVANCSVMDTTANSIIALISIKLYNLPSTKAVTNKNIRVNMLIYQSLRYSVAFVIDSISNGYRLITIHELNNGFSLPLNTFLVDLTVELMNP